MTLNEKRTQIGQLMVLLSVLERNAPDEDMCSDEENEFYADVANLRASGRTMCESAGIRIPDGMPAMMDIPATVIDIPVKDGRIHAEVNKGDDYPGISVCYETEQNTNPGIVLEYDGCKDVVQLRIYDDGPGEEPKDVLVIG